MVIARIWEEYEEGIESYCLRDTEFQFWERKALGMDSGDG